jgi:ATP-binding cassette, subfamily F, member 3
VGALQPLRGKTVLDSRAKIEYLAQHQLEQLDPDGTPLQTMIDRYPGDRSNSHIGELRRYLANFGLGGEVLPVQKIYTMSGGECSDQHIASSRRSKVSTLPGMLLVSKTPLAYLG